MIPRHVNTTYQSGNQQHTAWVKPPHHHHAPPPHHHHHTTWELGRCPFILFFPLPTSLDSILVSIYGVCPYVRWGDCPPGGLPLLGRTGSLVAPPHPPALGVCLFCHKCQCYFRIPYKDEAVNRFQTSAADDIQYITRWSRNSDTIVWTFQWLTPRSSAS